MILFKKKILVSVMLSGLLVGFLATPNPQNHAEAGIYVTDLQNIAENTKTAINTYSNAINTANQVQLEIRNLASMDQKALITHYLGIDKQYKKIMDYLDEQVGTLNLGTSTDTVLDEMGANNNLYLKGMSDEEFRNSIKKMYHVEDDTYKSALAVGRQQERVEDSIKSLEDSLKNLHNAQGQKEALQAQGQIASQGIIEQNKTVNALYTLVGIIATDNIAQNAEKEAQMKKNEQIKSDTAYNIQKAKDQIDNSAQKQWDTYQDVIHGR